jgi:hypothetical protein
MVEIEKKPTGNQLKALGIIREHGPLRPREFARFMWPDSEGWNHHVRCGPNGSHKGGGMYTSAGMYLGKLYQRGWLRREDSAHQFMGFVLSGAGREILLKFANFQGEN